MNFINISWDGVLNKKYHNYMYYKKFYIFHWKKIYSQLRSIYMYTRNMYTMMGTGWLMKNVALWKLCSFIHLNICHYKSTERFIL